MTPFRRSDDSEATPDAAGLRPQDYRTAVHDVCEAEGRIPLDGFEALSSEALLADGLHPNDAGHRRMARWLERALRAVLDRGELPLGSNGPNGDHAFVRRRWR